MSRVGMHEVTREGITHIVRNLRPRDRREIFALRWDDSEAQLITDVTRFAGPLWKVWSWDHEPVAINGVILTRPGVAQACAFGTEKWKYTLRDMTRWSRAWVIPSLQNANYHRGEAYVLAANVDARKWIETLGGEIEAYLHQYGRNCEDFILYTWKLNAVTNKEDPDLVSRWRRRRRRWHADGACRGRRPVDG